MGVGAAAKAALKAGVGAGGDMANALGRLRRAVGSHFRRGASPDVKTPPTAASLTKDADTLDQVAADVDNPLNDLKSHPLDDSNVKGGRVTSAKWSKVAKYGVLPTSVIGTIGAATYLTIAGIRLQNTDGVEVKITKITKGTNQFKVEYQTQGGQKCGPSGAKVACIQNAFNPSKGDYFTFRNTHTNPGLDGQTLKVIGSESSHDVIIEGDITSAGDGKPEWGYMTCRSSFANQFHDTVRDTVKLIVDTAFDLPAGAKEGICDNVKIPILCGTDGINWWIVVAIIVCCCCCMMSILLLTTLK
jgi:hypothetical protein